MVTIGGSERAYELVHGLARKFGGSPKASEEEEDQAKHMADIFSDCECLYRLYPPRRLKYVLQMDRFIGEGGGGSVFKATPTHVGLERVPVLREGQAYAVKRVKPGGALQMASVVSSAMARTSKQRIKDFLSLLASDEAHNAHIVKMFAVVLEVPRQLYTVMEFLDGPDLFEFLAVRIRPVKESQALTVAKQVFVALDFLHSRVGLVHRDVKPENICFSSQFDKEEGPLPPVKLIDFGLGWVLPECVTEETARELHHSPKVGTPAYMAPEIWDGLSGPPCDMWSAGVVTHILLSGDLPFQLSKTKHYPEAIAAHELDFADERWRSVRPEAQAFVSKALRKDVKERGTAAELLRSPWLLSASSDNPPNESWQVNNAHFRRRSKAHCDSIVMWDCVGVAEAGG